VIDSGVVFPIPQIVLRHATVPRVQPLTNERENFGLIVAFGLLKAVQGFTSGIETTHRNETRGDKHSRFIVVSAGLGQQFASLFNGLGPQASQCFFPHRSTCLFLTNDGRVACKLVLLDANQEVDVVCKSGIFDQGLQPVTPFQFHCTLTSLVGVQVKRKGHERTKFAD